MTRDRDFRKEVDFTKVRQQRENLVLWSIVSSQTKGNASGNPRSEIEGWVAAYIEAEMKPGCRDTAQMAVRFIRHTEYICGVPPFACDKSIPFGLSAASRPPVLTFV
jgi:hypothetical protein